MALIDKFIKPAEPVKPAQPTVKPTMVSPASSTMATPVTEQVKLENVASTPTMNVTESNINSDIVRNIWDVIIGKNLPGPDYLELKNSAAALESMGLPENVRYEAAFKMLKTSYPNFTKDILLSSIDTYINIVNEEKEEGTKQCQAKRERSIGDKNKRIEQLTTHSADIKKQIAALEQEYNEVLNSIKNLEAEVQVATSEINNEEAVFLNSVAEVQRNLNNDKSLMATLNI